MQGLTIHAASAESARAIAAALEDFDPTVIVLAGGRYDVAVDLRRGEIVRVIAAIEHYVNEPSGGTARIEFEGRDYTMHPD